MNIILGTANFGKEYGHNKVRVHPREAQRILMTAHKLGIKTIETAYTYDCVGILGELGKNFDLIYKYDNDKEIDAVENWVGDITFMKHHPPYKKSKQYTSDWDFWSIYSGLDIPKFMESKPKGIEVPLNLIDQRFILGKRLITSYWDGGCSNPTVYARSVFIQGLAFGMPDFHGIPFYHLCWNFVRNNPHIDGIVVGVDTAKQLEDILSIPNYEIDYSNVGGEGWIKTL